jgi:cysteine sulfinate desulfinase/cysteine desulfurase-like protein
VQIFTALHAGPSQDWAAELFLRFCSRPIFTEQAMPEVNVLIGAGSIGQAIARRVSAGKHVILADLRRENANAAAKTLSEAGFDVTAVMVDVSSRASVENLINNWRSLRGHTRCGRFPFPKHRQKA